MSSDPLTFPAGSGARRGRGRPPAYSEAERARRILQAAENVFTTAGYGAATMEAIARTVGMSKKTLYDFYPDKRQLLVAVTVAADDFPWEDGERTPSPDALTELRHRLLTLIRFILTPRQVRLTRLLIAEAAHEPELADDFNTRVMMRAQAYVEAAVAQALQSGHGPAGGDAGRLARALIGVAVFGPHMHALLGKLDNPGHEQLAAQVETALEICGFLPA